MLCAARWPGLELAVKEQNISALTDWRIRRETHTLVLHLAGPIRRLETELEGAGLLHHPPMAGESWVIPSEARYASLAQGGIVRYAELFFDPLPAATPIRPRAGFYDPFLFHAVTRLESLAQRSDDLARMAAHSLSQSIYGHFFLEYAGNDPAPPPPSAGLSPAERSRLLSLLAENLDSALTLDRLAGEVHRSVNEFLIAFRAAFGATPAQYIIDMRLRRARWLLTHTSYGIARIALETGFASHSHLAATFRARLGMTPSEFRRAHRGV